MIEGLENDLKEYEGDLESILSNLGSVSRSQAFINTASNQNILKRKRLQSLASQFGPDLRDNRQIHRFIDDKIFLLFHKIKEKKNLTNQEKKYILSIVSQHS